MIVARNIAELPSVPAVYALYGGTSSQRYVAYVGIGASLRQRIEQHLVRRDSSIATGVSAVHLNPDRVVAVRWWEHQSFSQSDCLEAAELIAFDLMNPALRSRGNVTERARSHLNDMSFVEQLRSLLAGEATGELIIPSLSTALQDIAALHQQVTALEHQIATIQSALRRQGIVIEDNCSG